MATILIAEDDKTMRHFLAEALKKAGHTVKVFENGLDAYNALKDKNSFDLLLADIVMPGMDGIELSQKATDICPDLKIMFITGFTAIAKDAAIDDHNVMSKPFHLGELVKRVDDMLAA